MSQPADHPETSAEFLAAEASTTIADETPSPLPPPDAPAPVIRGAVWTIAGFGLMQILRFLVNLVLTRVVEKYVFGVMTTVSLCKQGLHMFSDLGVKQCVVNSHRGDEERFLNTAWTVQVIRGGFLFLIACAIAWPYGWFYQRPEMYWLIPIVGLTAVCEGCAATAALTMSRRLQRGVLVIREICAYIGATTILISWLLMIRWNRQPGDQPGSHQMFAFAVSDVATAFFEMALSYTLIRGVRNHFAWERQAAKELIHFGGWVFVSTALTYLANNLDRLFVGKIGQEVLADYNIAAQLARLPTLLIAALGHQFLFPLYSKLQRDGIPLSQSFSRMHFAVTGFAALFISGVLAAGPSFIWLVYPEEYRVAGDYIRWLGIAAWFTILQTSSEVAVLSQGRTRQLAAGHAVKLTLLLPLLLIGYHFFDIFGVIAGYTIAEAARYVVLSSALAMRGLPVFRLDLLLTLMITFTAGIAIVAGPHCEGGGDRFARFGFRCAAEVAIVVSMWAIAIVWWWRRHGPATLAVVQGNKS